MDSFTTAASLVILWRYLRGEGWREPWYAWTLVECATAVSVARTGLPHTDRTPTAEDRSTERDATATAVVRPQLPAPDHSAVAGNGSGPPRDSRTRVRELVARERTTGIRLAARDVAAAAGISERRAYELLRVVRAEEPTP